MKLTGKSIIGTRQGAENKQTFHGINPATGETLEPAFTCVRTEEVREAAELAATAAVEYSRVEPARRARFLEEIADRIESLGDVMNERATQETALPEGRIKGETARTTGQLRAFARLLEEGSWVQARIDPAQPDREPMPRPDVRSMLRPLGPVAVFGASNFPLAFSVAGGDTASALAAGCPVIAKAHPSHPGVSELIGSCIRAAAESTEMPDGVFSLILDSGIESGQELVRHPSVSAVGFTGSRGAGTALMKIAAERSVPIPVYAEMSSVNPVFLLPGAIKERGDSLTTGLAGSCNLGVGQFCTNPGLVVLQAGEAQDAWRDRFIATMQEVGPGVLLNAGIQKAYREAVVKRQKHSAVTTLLNSNSDTGNPGVLPAIFEVSIEDFLKEPTMGDEIFGPATTLIRYRDVDSLERLAAALEGQLTATVHAADGELDDYRNLIRILETRAGRILFNSFPTGVEVCHSMVHGGPYPATSDGRTTSVGTHAIERFCRLVCWQDARQADLPAELQDANPLGITRLLDGALTRDPV